MLSELSNSEVLKQALADGIIDINTLSKQIEMNERKKYLEMHKYNIWQGEKDGKWYTYLPDKKKGRRLIKRTNQRGIEDVIISYWKEEKINPTVDDIYKEWLSDKLSREEIQKATRDRYNRQYGESMKDFGKRKIKSIEECDIEDFVLSAIYEHKLTSKGYSNLRTLIYGTFKRAKKRKLVDFSITEVIADMEISKKSFRKNNKPDEELVFSEIEKDKIINYIQNSKMDIISIGILLYFKTGMRPGELSAIKQIDVDERIIHICRTEICYKDENGNNVYEVRDFPKTEAGIRDIIIPLSAKCLIKKAKMINPFGEYLFERNGKRLRTYNFTVRLKSICKKVGVKPKSLNKIRKTYATTLIDSGVEESLIISQMGHTDITTTKKYYYKNRKDLEEKKTIIDNVSNL